MGPPQLRVEWGEYPEDWMLEAAVAFDTAMHQCIPPPGIYSDDPLVVHISVFRESERPDNFHGEALPTVPEGEIHVIAHPMVRKLKKEAILNTQFGTWLKKHLGLFHVVAFALCITLSLAVNPGGQQFTVPNPDDKNKEIIVTRSHPAWMVFRCHLIVGAVYMALHTMSYDLFKCCLCSFEVAGIVFFGVTAEIGTLYERFSMLSMIGELGITDVILKVIESVVLINLHGCVSCMDSCLVDFRQKLGALIVYVCGLLFHYVRYRFFVKWSSTEFCYFTFCTSPQVMYLGATANQIVFALTLLIPYSRHRSFGALKSNSIDPTVEYPIGHGRVSKRPSVTFQIGNAPEGHASRESRGQRCALDEAPAIGDLNRTIGKCEDRSISSTPRCSRGRAIAEWFEGQREMQRQMRDTE